MFDPTFEVVVDRTPGSLGILTLKYFAIQLMHLYLLGKISSLAVTTLSNVKINMPNTHLGMGQLNPEHFKLIGKTHPSLQTSGAGPCRFRWGLTEPRI